LPFSTSLLSAHSHLQIAIVVYGMNLLLISLTSLLQLSYLANHPELSHNQLTLAWIDQSFSGSTREATQLAKIDFQARCHPVYYQ
jgi:uncharacterized membrane protein